VSIQIILSKHDAFSTLDACWFGRWPTIIKHHFNVKQRHCIINFELSHCSEVVI